MVNVTISRKKEFNNFTQKFKLILDGQIINEISSGQSLVLNIKKNSVHKLQAKQNVFYSRTLEIKADGDITLEVSGPKYANFAIFSLLGLGIINLLLRKTDFHFSFLIVILILFIIQLYNFTLGRKRYLSLRKIDIKR